MPGGIDEITLSNVVFIMYAIRDSAHIGNSKETQKYKVEFNDMLTGLNLSTEQIQLQSIEELRLSFQKIETLIQCAEPNKGIRGNSVLLPTLLKLKKLILDNMGEKVSEDGIQRIVSGAKTETNAELKEQIVKLVETNTKWQSMSIEIEKARQKAQEQVDNKAAEREAFKERWAIWRSFLEKESVSTILGAFLLLIIVICLIVTTFTHTTPPQILNDGFLVLLGYFFGQTAANAGRKDKGK